MRPLFATTNTYLYDYYYMWHMVCVCVCLCGTRHTYARYRRHRQTQNEVVHQDCCMPHYIRCACVYLPHAVVPLRLAFAYFWLADALTSLISIAGCWFCGTSGLVEVARSTKAGCTANTLCTALAVLMYCVLVYVCVFVFP